MSTDDKEIKTHPSYGMIGINRVGGNAGKLFGSALNTHQHSIRITLYSGAWEHALNHDRYYAESVKPLMEVELSPAQFAEFITNPNSGFGVPCTIRANNGQRVADPPPMDTEVERVHASFYDDMKVLGKKCREYATQVETILSKSTSTKAERMDAIKNAKMLIQHIESNIPFALEMFSEATERVVTSAKAEIEAAMMHKVMIAGHDALRESSQAALKSGDED